MMDMEKLGAELLSGRQGGAIRDMANSPEAKKLGAAIDPAAAERPGETTHRGYPYKPIHCDVWLY